MKIYKPIYSPDENILSYSVNEIYDKYGGQRNYQDDRYTSVDRNRRDLTYGDPCGAPRNESKSSSWNPDKVINALTRVLSQCRLTLNGHETHHYTAGGNIAESFKPKNFGDIGIFGDMGTKIKFLFKK